MRRTIAKRCAATSGGQQSVGYGPFSNTAKRRPVPRQDGCDGGRGTSGSSSGRSPDVMQHVQLPTNHHLRTSLAALLHPSDMQRVHFGSPAWRLQMVRLYRTILRLHNKTVAVSLDRSQRSGAEAAVSFVTGVHHNSSSSSGSGGAQVSASERQFLGGSGVAATAPCQAVEDPTQQEDYLLRYLLTEQQREFGNRFVQQEFARHRDADAVYATIFYESWYQYILQLASGVTAKDMSEAERRMLTEEQREKLKELRGAFLSLRASNEPGYMP